MKKIMSMLLLVCLLTTSVVALGEDEFDVSADTSKVEELGIPTPSSVNTLRADADNLWRTEDYEKAAPAYALYAKNANWLANLISAGLDPFYDGTKDEKSTLYRDKEAFYKKLVSGEKKSNSYKTERNRAMAYEALCYYKLGDYTTAVPLLTKALDLIEIDQVEYWELCMDALYDIIGYKP